MTRSTQDPCRPSVIGLVACLFALFACAPAPSSEPLTLEEATPVPAVELATLEPGAKWALFTAGSTRLRGANLHPCSIFGEQGDCIQEITLEDVQALRDAGANLIHASYPGIYTVDAPFQVDEVNLTYLDNLIRWAEQADIYVIITYRAGPGRDEGVFSSLAGANRTVWDSQEAQDAWADMWRFTAERYKDSPVVVGYDLLTEPTVNTLIDPSSNRSPQDVAASAAGTTRDWNRFAANLISAIREVDQQTPIIVDAMNWAGLEWLPALRIFDDPYVAYGVHIYDPDLYLSLIHI
ncbi:MAG: glycoside hydrolase family 5 protein, partial [Chloroflexi bacterium]|nr:glycoside hydrolase family 5 protein [Chloroflexota bacterium]